jgi:hypothetical protein
MALEIKEKIIGTVGQGYFSITSDGWQKPSRFPAFFPSSFLMLEVFHEMKTALLKTEDELREIELTSRPAHISQNNWTGLKRLASTLRPISREDFALIGELCRVLKVFHVETCLVFYIC